ncbi:MAG: hypothetical protein GY816_11925 [Cytophagales bacterium]|nr:hypothetical protein [Cytophagales bacterium]
MPVDNDTTANERDQRNLRNNVTTLTTELAGLTTSINAQRTEINQNFRTLEDRLHQVEAPQMLNLTGGRSTDSLTTYDGDTDFDDWLSLFNRVKEAYNWSDARALKILPAYLRGNAADLYNELTDNQKTTIGELITNMRAALEPEEMARITQSKLIKRRMQPFESVVDFASSIQRLVKSAYRKLPAEAQDTLMLNHFIERIRPKIKRFLLLMDPKDYQTAKRKAIQIESHNMELENDVDEVAHEGKRNEKKQHIFVAQEEPDELKSMLAEILNEIRNRNDQNQHPSSISSNSRYRPNYSNHKLPQCNGRWYPQNPQQGPRVPWNRPRQNYWEQGRAYGAPIRYQGSPSERLICYKCGGYDHTSAICHQNQGRNFGAPQPFHRPQNETSFAQNFNPHSETRPVPVDGAINGIQTPVVYQYLPYPISTIKQPLRIQRQQDCVRLKIDSDNQINVLMEVKTAEEQNDLDEHEMKKIVQGETSTTQCQSSATMTHTPQGDVTMQQRQTEETDRGNDCETANCSTGFQQKFRGASHRKRAKSCSMIAYTSSLAGLSQDIQKLEDTTHHNREKPMKLQMCQSDTGTGPSNNVKSTATCKIEENKEANLRFQLLPIESETWEMRYQHLLHDHGNYPSVESFLLEPSPYQQHQIWSQSPQYGIYWDDCNSFMHKRGTSSQENHQDITSQLKVEEVLPSDNIIEAKEESVSTSSAYSSEYLVGWGSLPDLVFPISPPMRANMTRKWKSCSFQSLYSTMLLLLTCSLFHNAASGTLSSSASQPMLRQISKAGTQWRLQKLPKCHVAKRSFSAQLFIETLEMYKKNLAKYESSPHQCKIFYHEIQTFTCLFASRMLKHHILKAQPWLQQDVNQTVKQTEYNGGLRIWHSAPYAPPGKTKISSKCMGSCMGQQRLTCHCMYLSANPK